MSARKIVANLVGLVGCVAVAWGIHGLMQVGTCGGPGAPPCPPGATPYAVALAIGLPAAIIAAVAGGALAFVGLFPAVAVGALWAGLELPAEQRGVPLTIGGIFGAVTLLPLGFLPFALAKARRMKRLLDSGGTAIGTVTAVADTGTTINKNPRVRLTLRIEPQDGSAPFDGEKTVTMSRLDPARPGRCYPVWYDRDDPAVFAIGTTMQSHASVEVRRLFALAERQELQGRHQFAGTPTAAPAAAGDPIDDLARLHELRRSGALTDAEFDTMKARIIGRD